LDQIKMKKSLLRSLATVALSTVAVGSLIAGFAGTAYAAGNAPWQPVANPPQAGTLTFYNAAGQQITGGSTTSQPLAAYVQGSATLRAGDTTATLSAVTPVLGQPVGAWSGEQLSGSPNFPNSGAPGSLGTSALPLVTGTSSDESLSSYVSDFPNSDTSTTDGYAGIYELRLVTGASGKPLTTSYDAADIQITGTTWSVVYPTPTLTSTSTSLGTSPPSPSPSGTSVTLTATVSPSAPGTVQFEYGSGTPTLIGTPVTVSGGTASIATTALPVGTDALSAVFTPSSGSAYSGSTGTASYTISPTPAAATATALGVNPTTAAADTAVDLTATVTSSGTPVASGAGTVNFYDNGTSTADTASGTLLQSVAVGAGGVAALSYSSFAVGAHNIVAEFLPADPTTYNSSLSPSVLFTATAPLYAPDPQTVEVGIPSGTLTITTPYGPSNPFQLGQAVLDPSDSKFTASAQFGTPATDGTPGAGGVTITDTRAGQQGWSASAEVGNFTDSSSDVINSQNLTFTDVEPQYISGNALQSGVTTFPVGNSAIYSPTATGTDGLGGEQHLFASAPVGASDGSVYINGLLTLTAPTSTPAGTYTATLTFTIS
jgi:Bacterial Ig-like domain (group 3)/WxL domain surface cell wall-binding